MSHRNAMSSREKSWLIRCTYLAAGLLTMTMDPVLIHWHLDRDLAKLEGLHTVAGEKERGREALRQDTILLTSVSVLVGLVFVGFAIFVRHMPTKVMGWFLFFWVLASCWVILVSIELGALVAIAVFLLKAVLFFLLFVAVNEVRRTLEQEQARSISQV